MARKNRAKSDVSSRTRRESVSSSVQSPKSALFSNLFPMSPTMNAVLKEEPSRTPEEWIEFAQNTLWESGKPAPAVWFLATQEPDLLEYLMTGTMRSELSIGYFVKLINTISFV
jgi:hypothetical protein